MLTAPRSRQRENTLTQKAYEVIKRALLEGELEEGSFIFQAEIRKKYGIGRTPFREACIRLQQEGFLDVVPRRGFLVPETTLRDLREMFELRMALESAIAELAAVKAKSVQVEELERLAKETRRREDSESEATRLVKANTEFHLCLAKMTQNGRIVELMKWTLERTERLSYLELRDSSVRFQELQMHHTPIVEAIRKRDPLAAKKAVLRDISQGQREIFGTFWMVGKD